jgi:alkylhydroperoxidase/carboxymuconolactone decarboxylase family protein YurZ
MPIVRLSLRKGRSPDYIQQLSNGVHRTLVEAFDVPPDDRFQFVHQHEPHELLVDPTYLGGPRSDAFVLVAVTAGRPRSTVVKRRFYARLVEVLAEQPGIRPEDVMVVISTTQSEDWSFSGGAPYEPANDGAAPSAQGAFGDVSPKLASLTDEVLFGDVWQRPGLAPRERSLVTVAALVALGRVEQLPFHIDRALRLGISHDELSELVTHLAFYAGWPAAASAVARLREAFARDGQVAPVRASGDAEGSR